MARRLPGYAVFVLGVALSAAALAASQPRHTGSPTLPRLALENLPPPVRAGLERTYDDARAHPRDASAMGRLAMMLHAYEQYRSADACYRIARELERQALSWAYLGGVVQAELGENGTAVASFRQALRIDPAYLPARLKVADALMKAGGFDASHAEYDALVRDFPELAVAHYGLGRVSSVLGDSTTAARHYERAVDAAPQFGPAHYALALAYRDMGLGARAQSHLEAYRQFGSRRPVLADPLLEQVRSMRGSAGDLIAEGARLGKSGRLEEAIAVHLKALEIDPTAAQAHVNLISLYGRAGQPAKAEAHYRAALALEASLADAHYNYGVLLTSGRYTEAAAAFRKTLDVNPFHAQAHNNLAALLAQEGNLQEAEAHYRQAVANHPQHRTARFNLGRVLVALGRPREAVEQFHRTLLPEDADTPRYMHALANAYFAAGDFANAREYGQQALGRAERLGQTELAAKIEKELQRVPPVRR